jgi:hypothetical protein
MRNMRSHAVPPGGVDGLERQDLTWLSITGPIWGQLRRLTTAGQKRNCSLSQAPWKVPLCAPIGGTSARRQGKTGTHVIQKRIERGKNEIV